MQQLGLNNYNTGARYKGFWARQFQNQPTEKQKVFDCIFGIILPTACFLLDPIVFRSFSFDGSGGKFESYKAFAYILAFVSILSLTAWLAFGKQLKWLNALFGGLFVTGGIIALTIGVLIFPLSLLGIFFVIGILGFTPFFSAIVYLRNGLRAAEAAKTFLGGKISAYAFYLSVVFTLVVPFSINAHIKRLTEEMLTADASTIRANGAKLNYVAPFVDKRILQRGYLIRKSKAESREETKALIEVYARLTGENLEGRESYD